ncbi:MAG: helix-turn-helix domain-containing protein [Pseudonocardiaceae bacterium]
MTLEKVPPQLRRLGLMLRGLRRDANLTGQQLAERVGLSQSTVSRIELGQAVPSVSDVEQWVAATGAPDEQHAELLALAEAVAVETIAWRRVVRRGLPELQQDVRELEATAGVIRNFQPTIVPGLLQTAEYARQLIASGYPEGRQDIATAIAARMDRQAILYDEAKRLEFLIAEVALRWRLGPPAMMRAQLDRIANTMTLSHLTVGIIPQTAEMTAWHIHGFTILDDREDGPVVRVETLTTGLSITDPSDVGRYQQAFHLLREAAVFDDHAQALLRTMIAEVL